MGQCNLGNKKNSHRKKKSTTSTTSITSSTSNTSSNTSNNNSKNNYLEANGVNVDIIDKARLYKNHNQYTGQVEYEGKLDKITDGNSEQERLISNIPISELEELKTYQFSTKLKATNPIKKPIHILDKQIKDVNLEYRNKNDLNKANELYEKLKELETKNLQLEEQHNKNLYRLKNGVENNVVLSRQQAGNAGQAVHTGYELHNKDVIQHSQPEIQPKFNSNVNLSNTEIFPNFQNMSEFNGNNLIYFKLISSVCTSRYFLSKTLKIFNLTNLT